ncbi:MAG: hypothetical protein MHM6MM_001212 [Cercozoa sp. M6MM]
MSTSFSEEQSGRSHADNNGKGPCGKFLSCCWRMWFRRPRKFTVTVAHVLGILLQVAVLVFSALTQKTTAKTSRSSLILPGDNVPKEDSPFYRKPFRVYVGDDEDYLQNGFSDSALRFVAASIVALSGFYFYLMIQDASMVDGGSKFCKKDKLLGQYTPPGASLRCEKGHFVTVTLLDAGSVFYLAYLVTLTLSFLYAPHRPKASVDGREGVFGEDSGMEGAIGSGDIEDARSSYTPPALERKSSFGQQNAKPLASDNAFDQQDSPFSVGDLDASDVQGAYGEAAYGEDSGAAYSDAFGQNDAANSFGEIDVVQPAPEAPSVPQEDQQQTQPPAESEFGGAFGDEHGGAYGI